MLYPIRVVTIRALTDNYCIRVSSDGKNSVIVVMVILIIYLFDSSTFIS